MTEAHVAEVAQLFLSQRVCRRDRVRQRIRTALAATPGLSVVAESDGHVVGAALACFDGFHVHISNFAVDEDFQRLGIGTRLHKAIERRARRFDAQAIVAGAWMKSTGFYYELGYTTPRVVYLVNDL